MVPNCLKHQTSVRFFEFRYAFPEQLNLEEFLDGESKKTEPTPLYTLHAVLVHSGKI